MAFAPRVHEGVEDVRHVPLLIWEQVGVAIGDVNALVAHPVGDCHGGEAKVDQERNVAVPQVVNPDLLDPCKLCGGLQGVVEGVLGERKEALVFVRLPLHLHVFLELLCEEPREGDDPFRLLRLRLADDVPAV